MAWFFERFPETVDRYIPWICLAILWHLSYEIILENQGVKERFARSLRQERRMVWICAFVVGGCISLIYLWTINRELASLASEHGKSVVSQKPTPAERPQESQKSDIPPSVRSIPNPPQPDKSTAVIKGGPPDLMPELVKPAKPSRATASETQLPLQIVAFYSTQEISIANNGPFSIYAVILLVSDQLGSKSFGLDFEIAPGKTTTKVINDGFPHVRTFGKLADSWEEHFAKATEQYKGCWQFSFFSPSDVRLQQMKDFYTSIGTALPYKEVPGALYYKMDNHVEVSQQKVTLVTILTVNEDVCP